MLVLSLLRLVSASPSCAAAVPVAPSLLSPVVVASTLLWSRLLPLCPLTLLGSPRACPVWFAHLLLVRFLHCLLLSWSSAMDFFFFRFVPFGVADCSHRSIDVPPPRPRFAAVSGRVSLGVVRLENPGFVPTHPPAPTNKTPRIHPPTDPGTKISAFQPS